MTLSDSSMYEPNFDDAATLVAPTKPNPASVRSIKYMRDLTRQRDYGNMVASMPPDWRGLFLGLVNMMGTHTDEQIFNLQSYAQVDVSKFIDQLLRMPAKSAPEQVARSPRRPIEDGLYVVDGTIYKVQHAVNGSGYQYAKKLVPDRYRAKASFRNAPSAIRNIRPEHKMSMAEAAKFGKLYGVCVICGRTLTDEISIALGIGPICGSRNFGEKFDEMRRAADVIHKYNGNNK
jgi:hypothetical protein